MKSTVCIIILNFNSFELTSQLVDSLSDQEINHQIVLVDNHSTDNSFLKLCNIYEKNPIISIIQTSKNLGYAFGNNFGIKYAIKNFNPDFIAILNPDVIVSQNFIQNMMKLLETDSKLVAVTGLMLNMKNEMDLQTIAWKIPTGINDFFLNSGLLTKLYNPIQYKSLTKFEFPDDISVVRVETIPGSCFFIKSEIMEKIGFFDENTFLYCEERILAKRIKENGYYSGLSLSDSYIHNHERKNKAPLKTKIFHYSHLIKSRYYFNQKYNQTSILIITPFFILSAAIGFFEVISKHYIDIGLTQLVSTERSKI